jgi:hypothetical protein
MSRIVEGPPFPSYFIGVDLGKTHDCTAAVVVERNRVGTTCRYDVVGLLRSARGTPYPQVVASVARLCVSPELRPQRHYAPNIQGGVKVEAAPNPMVIVDATGVGVAVVDMFMNTNINARVVPLTITGGGKARQDVWPGSGRTCFYVPKIELVGTVQALLQQGLLKVAAGLELAATLKEELFSFEVKITQNANETYGAWREVTNDGLLMSTSMDVWMGEYREPSHELIRFPHPLAAFRGDSRDPAHLEYTRRIFGHRRGRAR